MPFMLKVDCLDGMTWAVWIRVRAKVSGLKIGITGMLSRKGAHCGL